MTWYSLFPFLGSRLVFRVPSLKSLSLFTKLSAVFFSAAIFFFHKWRREWENCFDDSSEFRGIGICFAIVIEVCVEKFLMKNKEDELFDAMRWFEKWVGWAKRVWMKFVMFFWWNNEPFLKRKYRERKRKSRKQGNQGKSKFRSSFKSKMTFFWVFSNVSKCLEQNEKWNT